MNLGLVLLALGALIAHTSATNIYKTCPHYKIENMIALDCTGQFKNSTQTNTTFDYTGYFKHESLILSNNNIDIDFLNKINFTGVEILNLSRNKIQDLNFNSSSTWSELTELDASFNNLSTLKVDFFLQFQSIQLSNLSNNEISEIKPSDSNVVAVLKSLDLSHNKLTNLNSSYFKNFRKLENLTLSFNLIDSIEEKAFSHLFVLESLRLENNRLKKIDFAVPEKLYYLFLANYQYEKNASANSISVFPNNTSLRMLKTLDFSFNNFTSFPESLNKTNFPELESVEFTGNPIVNTSSVLNGTVNNKPLIIFRNISDSVSPNVTKNNQTSSVGVGANNETLSAKIESTLNSTGTENSTVSTEKLSNQTATTTESSNSTTPISISNSTVTDSSNKTMADGLLANTTASSFNVTTATSLNETSTQSPEVETSSVTVYSLSIIAGVIVVILIIGLISCYRQSVLKRRRQNRRY